MTYKFAIKGYCGEDGEGCYEICTSTGYHVPQGGLRFDRMQSNYIKNTTRDCMELRAAICALSCTLENSPVTITTTSKYLAEGFRQAHADNSDLWAELETLADKRHVTFVYVEDVYENALAANKNKEAVKMATDNNNVTITNEEEITMTANTTDTAVNDTVCVNNEEETKMTYKFAIKGYCTDGEGRYEIRTSSGYHSAQRGFCFDPIQSDPIKDTTHNQMELTAAIVSLNLTPENSNVEIISESQYLVKGLNQNHDKNLDLWNELTALVNTRTVSFKYVKDAFGEIVDEIHEQLIHEQLNVAKAIKFPRVNLTDEQSSVVDELVKFVKRANDTEFVLLQGCAGTGKTTLASALISKFRWTKYEVYATALTNKAAQVLKSNGVDASTIHTILYKPVEGANNSTRLVPTVDIGKIPTQNPEFTTFIVDEASMADDEILNEIERYAETFKSRFIFLADPFQLPPVGSSKKNVFSRNYKTFELTKVMRQKDGSEILDLATALRSSKTSFMPSESKNTVIISNAETMFNDYVNDLSTNKNSTMIVFKNQTRAILNTKIRTALGIDSTPIVENETLLAISNSSDGGTKTVSNGETFNAQNPRILYDGSIEYVSNNTRTVMKTRAIFIKTDNIKTRHILLLPDVQDSSVYHSGITDFDCNPSTLSLFAEYKKGSYRIVKSVVIATYGYTLTAHKSQGGQWDRVYIREVQNLANVIGNARWLYTAVTRAKNELVMIPTVKSVSWEYINSIAVKYSVKNKDIVSDDKKTASAVNHIVTKTIEEVNNMDSQANVVEITNEEENIMINTSETAVIENINNEEATAMENNNTIVVESETTNVKAIKLYYDGKIGEAKLDHKKSKDALGDIRIEGKTRIDKLNAAKESVTDKAEKKVIAKSLRLFRAELAVKKDKQQIIVVQKKLTLDNLKLAKVRAVIAAENGTPVKIEVEIPVTAETNTATESSVVSVTEDIVNLPQNLVSEEIANIDDSEEQTEASAVSDPSQNNDADEEPTEVEFPENLSQPTLQDTETDVADSNVSMQVDAPSVEDSTNEIANAPILMPESSPVETLNDMVESSADNENANDESIAKIITISDVLSGESIEEAIKEVTNPVEDVILIEASADHLQQVARAIFVIYGESSAINYQITWDREPENLSVMLGVFATVNVNIKNMVNSSTTDETSTDTAKDDTLDSNQDSELSKEHTFFDDSDYNPAGSVINL